MTFPDTIAAVSTPPGRGGVAVVRISGPDAHGIAASLAGGGIVPGRIAVRRVLGEECVVLAFAAPRSYTGEDVAELQCHGGIVAPRRLLDAALRCGARLARRGEFTERAFLNGRIDYEGAQAVIDLIDAKTDQAAEAALSGLAGESTRRLRECYEAALDVSSAIEHSLDIDEGELPDDFADGVAKRIAALLDSLDDATRRLRTRAIMRHGALVVLAGEPNAGKSSLFNALVQENRAIVSPAAGTTRDAIDAWLDIDGWPVRLVDTAGLRESSDAIEAEGVRRTEDYMARADVVLALGSGGEWPAVPAARGDGAATIRIHAKCDLSRGEGLNVSSKTGEGLDALRKEIGAALARQAQTGSPAGESGDEGERAVAAIMQASSHLRAALSVGGDLVLAGNAVRAAAEALGRHIGAEYTDDMLERLFSRFCVGK